MTDCNVMVGKIQPAFFPKVFGRRADEALDDDVVREKFATLAMEIEDATGRALTPEQLADGYLDIAVGNMAEAIKRISIQRGHDVTQYTLSVFGGAGGQHACRVADALGMTRIFVHPLAGVLSAYGMGLADQTAMREQSIERRLEADAMAALGDGARSPGVPKRRTISSRKGLRPSASPSCGRVHLRYEGTDSALIVAASTLPEMQAAFDAEYLKRYSFLMQQRGLVIEAVSVEAIGQGDAVKENAATQAPRSTALAPKGTARMFSEGAWRAAPLYARAEMRPGDVIGGPAIIAEANATTVVEPDWEAIVTELDHIVLERVRPRAAQQAIGTDADPIMLEVFNNLFMSIAEQMGLRLQNTAYSVNIKERLDFSCALFDSAGNLIANAPHMPVHLGSMSESIKTVMRENAGAMKPGDAYAINDPYHGGTHLPDVTVITPVFDRAGDEILFYVGSRGHHADIGGTTPGSMPPFSTSLDEEGTRFINFKLVDGQGVVMETNVRAGFAKPS